MKTLENLQSINIIYLEADINYTTYHLNDGSKIISSFTLKRHQETQNLASFLRINKSYLLNPIFIENVEKEGRRMLVKMKNNKQMQVSRRKVGLLKGINFVSEKSK